ncbi:MAG TPA: hybrid sensor histidine kinase/response regulator [Cyanobacteria bacterium UBA8803]|nr:hybrid sensor histidine kinase/response regulator [Cyanobacteria bacterium UBA9273]HBL59062.1 hybrid sensor histidine kinase/response regulator [Cyanobacteria bacterium UBA8803]
MNSHQTDRHKGNILIVDDTVDSLRLLSTALAEQGYEVRSTVNGAMALTAAHAAPPDLILLDIKMPDMSGYEVCLSLKASELTRDIPVIFISALDEVFDKVKAFAVGGADYITKPFQFAEVLARVENQLTIRQLTCELEQRVEERTAELKKALQDLQHAQVQLVQVEKMATLGQLVAAVAHEVNNPVGFINGNLNCVKDYTLDLINLLNLYQQKFPHPGSEIEQHIEEIDLEYLVHDLPKILSSMKQGIDRLLQLSSSLRTFSRMDTPSKVACNINEGIESTLLILKHQLKANQQRPAIEVIEKYGDLPSVECYPGQLNQVFMNIIANAIDSFDELNEGRSFEEIERHPHQITIRSEVNSNQDTVVIHISDNGSGISAEVQERIFDNFFTTKPLGKGTGLGLSITRQIVEEKHGGKLTCISTPGQGTEFVVEIPVRANG